MGDPHEVFSEDTVQAIFGLTSRVLVDAVPDRPMALPMGRNNALAPVAG